LYDAATIRWIKDLRLDGHFRAVDGFGTAARAIRALDRFKRLRAFSHGRSNAEMDAQRIQIVDLI
jgi:hypothetical protein